MADAMMIEQEKKLCDRTRRRTNESDLTRLVLAVYGVRYTTSHDEMTTKTTERLPHNVQFSTSFIQHVCVAQL